MLHAAPRISAADLASDRNFWVDLLALRPRSGILPGHTGGGYRNRRFAIIRDAAWITLYRSVTPSPQIGVFLRCTGLAGDGYFGLADAAREAIEPCLLAAVGPGAKVKWGEPYDRGMSDIMAMIAAPLPWDDAATGLHIAWLLRIGAVWWSEFASLATETVSAES